MKWGWNISALFYELGYSKLMHEIDGYTLGWLQGLQKLDNARVLDVGAGTGEIDFKLVRAGAREVVAIENNPLMLWRLRSKKKKVQVYEKIKIVDDDVNSGAIVRSGPEPYDVELFRRCLYGSDEENIAILQQGYKLLRNKGLIFIVHPEADKTKYFDNGFNGCAISHMLKWSVADIGSRIAIKYHRYRKEELEELCKTACPDAHISSYPPIRPAYNILTIQKL